MRKTCGFAQIAQKIAQNQNFVSCATFAKNISGFAQIAQKKLRKSSQKKICAKIAQILRKRFNHFVETLSSTVLLSIDKAAGAEGGGCQGLGFFAQRINKGNFP